MLGFLSAVALLPACAAGIDVRVKDAHVDVSAKAAPLGGVVDCLAERLEFKVVYMEPIPATRTVDVDTKGRTPREVIDQVFLGSQVNYALGMDKSNTTIKTLVILGVGSGITRPAPAADPTPYMETPMDAPMMDPTMEGGAMPPPTPYPGGPGMPGYPTPMYPGAVLPPGATPPPGGGMPSGTTYPGQPTPVPGAPPTYPGTSPFPGTGGYPSPPMTFPNPGPLTPGGLYPPPAPLTRSTWP